MSVRSTAYDANVSTAKYTDVECTRIELTAAAQLVSDIERVIDMVDPVDMDPKDCDTMDRLRKLVQALKGSP